MKIGIYVGLIALFVGCCSGYFYLPGVHPINFKHKDEVKLMVNKLTSKITQLPYEYYSLPFCRPEGEIMHQPENLGEILRGDRIESAAYLINMTVNVDCKILCARSYDQEQVESFAKKVREQYLAQWVVDNLPVARPTQLLSDSSGNTIQLYETGFFLGGPFSADGEELPEEETPFINNHVNIILKYNTEPGVDGYRIVGFEVEPESIGNFVETEYTQVGTALNAADCVKPVGKKELFLRPTPEGLTIPWTYSVKWELDTETSWANRWDKYLYNSDPQIHWFSIVNSLMIVLFLTGMLAMIMLRTVRADFNRYNKFDPQEEPEETGWKLVHGDVFRPPKRPMLLALLVGNGVQIFSMSFIVLIFSVLGFLSPSNRGGLGTAMLFLFVLMGVFAGYFATRTYKVCKGTSWKKTAFWTALGFPGLAFLIFFILNLFIWSQHSSRAVPFTILITLIALWFGISMPLVYLGAYFAQKKPVPEFPVRTNQIPRQIPTQVWYMSPLFSILMGGVLPFGASFIELFFILRTIWGPQLYYIFGFLFLVFLILIITCSEIAIVMIYFQLCSEDYHWWWRSFLTSGASAFYVFLYTIFYFSTQLEITHFVSALLYFGYSLIMSLGFFVLTGSIGFYSCYFFVRKIYSVVKID